MTENRVSTSRTRRFSCGKYHFNPFLGKYRIRVPTFNTTKVRDSIYIVLSMAVIVMPHSTISSRHHEISKFAKHAYLLSSLTVCSGMKVVSFMPTKAPSTVSLMASPVHIIRFTLPWFDSHSVASASVVISARQQVDT